MVMIIKKHNVGVVSNFFNITSALVYMTLHYIVKKS